MQVAQANVASAVIMPMATGAALTEISPVVVAAVLACLTVQATVAADHAADTD
jgi:hypothetical protein